MASNTIGSGKPAYGVSYKRFSSPVERNYSQQTHRYRCVFSIGLQTHPSIEVLRRIEENASRFHGEDVNPEMVGETEPAFRLPIGDGRPPGPALAVGGRRRIGVATSARRNALPPGGTFTPVPPRDRPCKDGLLLLAWIGLILDQDVHTLR